VIVLSFTGLAATLVLAYSIGVISTVWLLYRARKRRTKGG
jgi:uncharacterized membrane protein YqjE